MDKALARTPSVQDELETGLLDLRILTDCHAMDTLAEIKASVNSK